MFRPARAYLGSMPTLFIGALVLAEALSFSDALALARAAPAQQTVEQVANVRGALAEDVPRLTENPLVQVQPGARARAGGGGLGPEVYVSVTQPFLLSQLGKKRRTSVEREHVSDLGLAARTQRQVRRTVAEAWLARWSAQRAMATAAEERALARQLAERIGEVVAAGEATQVELSAARTWEAEAALLELTAEGQAFESGMQLTRVLGSDRDAPQAVLDALPELPLPAQEELAARLRQVEATPEVASARADAAASSARLEEVEAVRGTRMALGVLGWREGGGDRAAVATVELSAPLFERGQRERASARAEVARARGIEREAQVAARAQRVVLLHELEHTGKVLETSEHELLAAAEQLADAQRKRVEAHEATVQDWVLARRTVVRARLEVLRARAAHTLARFLVSEAWTGAPP